MDKSGGTDADVKTRIGKARSAYNMLKRYGTPEKSARPARYVCLTQMCIVVWSRNMADNQGIYEEDPDFYKSVLA